MTNQTTLTLTVRDYECDTQGIVNNAVHQHYLEHARHQWLLAHSLNFMDYTKAQVRLVVIRAEIDYKKPLLPATQFVISTKATLISPVRALFNQVIHRADHQQVALQAKIYVAAIDCKTGKIRLPQALIQLLQ